MWAGELDPECVGAVPPELTPEQASARTWRPDPATWRAIRNGSVEQFATVTIIGFAGSEAVSRGAVRIVTSRDPAGAPIFYRDVPLIPSPTDRGVIQPLPRSAIRLIQWRVRDLAEPESRTVMKDLPTCANCHSFSADGRTLGLDVDGPQNDKGLYALARVSKSMRIGREDVVRWSALQDRSAGEPQSQAVKRFGFMSQVSPDGAYVVTTIEDPRTQLGHQTSGLVRGLADRFFNAGYTDYRFGQVFYPTRGILAWYSRETGKLSPLPGADDPRYVHASAFWSPDGKYLIFSRAEARDPYPPGQKPARFANDPNETQIQYDLYRIPFNGGKGGTAERIDGASENGKSNNFPKVTPDGRWIVFVQCRNGLLMRPDSELYIVSFEGGQARRLRSNMKPMNSWHSFSPNGRWMVFSSKARSGYTQMYLTHLDDKGNDSPPVLVENATAANRAVNIPEFVNIEADGIAEIVPEATEFYRLFDLATDQAEKRQHAAALVSWQKAIALNPDDAKAHSNMGLALAGLGRNAEALAQYREAIRLGPDFPDGYTNLGIAQAQGGHLEEAVATLRKALELSPWDAKAYSNLGTALASAGRLEESAEMCRRALQIDPDDPDANANLAIALARIGRTEEAIERFRKALTAAPESADIHSNLALALIQGGRLDEAVPQFEAALKQDPYSTELNYSMGRLLATLGRFSESIPYLEKATSTSQDPMAMGTLAAAYAQSGRFDEALRMAQRGLEIASARGAADLVRAFEQQIAQIRSVK